MCLFHAILVSHPLWTAHHAHVPQFTDLIIIVVIVVIIVVIVVVIVITTATATIAPPRTGPVNTADEIVGCVVACHPSGDARAITRITPDQTVYKHHIDIDEHDIDHHNIDNEAMVIVPITVIIEKVIIQLTRNTDHVPDADHL